jgi:hypothetical protein
MTEMLSMKKTLAILACALLMAGTAWAYHRAAKRSRFVDEVVGYALDTPRFPGADAKRAGIHAIFLGPAEDGFSNNVNILVIKQSTSLDVFQKVSLAEIEKAKFKLIANRVLTISGHQAVEFEYEGMMNGRELHFIALSVVEDDRVVQVTCTASSKTFAAVEPEFRACLASFRLAPGVL